MKKIPYIIVLMLLAASCGKNNENCFTAAGPYDSVARTVDEYYGVIVYGNINVVLLPEHAVPGQILITGGKNILSGIRTEKVLFTIYNEVKLEGGETRTDTIVKPFLKIENVNTCNWMRDYSNLPTVYLPAYTDTLMVEYRSNGKIETRGQFAVDLFQLNVWDGSGDMDLNLKTKESHLNIHYGTVTIRARGETELEYVYSASYGLIDARDLRAILAYVTSYSSNDVYVNVADFLEAEAYSSGFIYHRHGLKGLSTPTPHKVKAFP